MNKARRKWLLDIKDKLDNIKSDIESLRDEEQESYDNIPYNLKDSEMGTTMYENIDELDEVISNLEDYVIDGLNEILER